jgi:hypothetical protein
MVKSHAASYTASLKVCCSIRIFCIFSPGTSVPKISLRDVSTKKASDSEVYPQSLTHPNQSAP